ncbi:MAG: site-2 protease family protein [Patescibacteria group bacterium]|nr:site-2 protease family protein [Patescibacteria group bacterium]
MEIVFQLIVLIFSVVIHEVSHGFIAEKLGDPTARLAGRLTLNPIKHLDVFGSVILPLLLWVSGTGIIFGWAKPVPYNPHNLKNPDKDGALVAAAGPLSNFSIALVFSLFLRLVMGMGSFQFRNLADLFAQIVLLNIVLAIFNLVPIPPLDGSKVLFAFLPESARKIRFFLEQYGMFIVFAFIFFGFKIILPIIWWVFQVLTGIGVGD